MASWYAKYAQRLVVDDRSSPSTLRFLARTLLDDALMAAFAYLRSLAPQATPRPVELIQRQIQSADCVSPGQTTRAMCSFPMPVHPSKIILENASRWTISDISVNHRSQTAQAGDIPGELFSEDLAGDGLTFEVIPPGAPLTICARYVGDDPDGEPLSCKVIGEVAIPRLVNFHL